VVFAGQSRTAFRHGRRNFMCIPGSHKTSRLDRPEDLTRISSSRRARSRSAHTRATQQLLGAGKNTLSFWRTGDVYPLREYLRERGLLDLKVSSNR
jgi:hypothetical protein